MTESKNLCTLNPVGADNESMRPEFAEMVERHSYLLDENRPEAVAKMARMNNRTARVIVEDL